MAVRQLFIAVTLALALSLMACNSDEPSATATPSPTAAPTATATPSPTAAPAATATPSPTTAPAATATPSPTTAPAATTAPDDDVVSRENPGLEPVRFDDSRSPGLVDLAPLGVVQWTVNPQVGGGELVAAGVLEEGFRLFSPWEGEGSAFSVYYVGQQEPLVEVLPDLGPMHIWETWHTVASAAMEIEGQRFSLEAYSPLFMDVGDASDLVLRVFGVGPDGEDVQLDVRPLGAME